jgi:hypothetical protein
MTGFPAVSRDFSRLQSLQTGCGFHLELCSAVPRRKAMDLEADLSSHPITMLGTRGAVSPLSSKPSGRVGQLSIATSLFVHVFYNG